MSLIPLKMHSLYMSKPVEQRASSVQTQHIFSPCGKKGTERMRVGWVHLVSAFDRCVCGKRTLLEFCFINFVKTGGQKALPFIITVLILGEEQKSENNPKKAVAGPMFNASFAVWEIFEREDFVGAEGAARRKKSKIQHKKLKIMLSAFTRRFFFDIIYYRRIEKSNGTGV